MSVGRVRRTTAVNRQEYQVVNFRPENVGLHANAIIQHKRLFLEQSADAVGSMNFR
jgi:hypothetical protein